MKKNSLNCDCNVIHQDIVDTVLKTFPKNDIVHGLVTTFKIIGDETRCRILLATSQQEMCVCDLANVLSMSKSSVSHQLALLRDAGLVKARKEGKEVYYMLDDEHVSEMFDVATQHIEHKMKGDKYED